MAVTLKQIAESVGLSVSAVSQILNRRPCNFCSEEKKKDVIRTAKELGYKQKFADKINRGDTTGTVAILKRTHHTMEVDQLVIRMLNKFEEISCSCYVVNFPRNSDVLSRVRDLIDRGVERFVLMMPVWNEDENKEFLQWNELAELIKKHNCTYISYGPSGNRYVIQDFAPAVKTTVQFFLNKIGTSFRMLLPLQGSNREKALYECFPDLPPETVRERFISPIAEERLRAINSEDEIIRLGYQLTSELLDSEPDIRGIYYMSDQLALGGIHALLARGLTPGKDIILAGFNDFPGVRYCGYPVSTAAHDLDALSEALVAESCTVGSCQRLIPPKIMIREQKISLYD
ncbi:MAG: LacI family DNA-binding transcriptional regulator [Lentisphaeria bacterium]|nr:LacI family DNA-binding transcriptional regulator [Lentisphaeria bacterium]